MNLPIEKQVCSRELAQELKEAGVPQESLFYWHVAPSPFLSYWNEEIPLKSRGYKRVAAYTVAELLQLLPASTCLVKKTIIKNPAEVRYYTETFEHHPAIIPNLHDENPANALVKLYINLYGSETSN